MPPQVDFDEDEWNEILFINKKSKISFEVLIQQCMGKLEIMATPEGVWCDEVGANKGF